MQIGLTGSSQGRKKRQHGNDAVKSHITAARTVANIVRTSLVGQAKDPLLKPETWLSFG